jgi:hypothetical protein
MPCCTWRAPFLSVHAGLEILPAVACGLFVPLGDLAAVLAKHVEQHDKVAGAPIQDPVELGPVVTTQLAQFAFDLRRV